MKQVLKIVNEYLGRNGIHYCFHRLRGEPEYPYYVGEIYETGNRTESGEREYDFILNGFDRGVDDVRLISTVETIQEIFPQEYGYLVKSDKESVCIWYDSMIPLEDDGETELVRNQVTLKVKSWKGKRNEKIRN